MAKINSGLRTKYRIEMADGEVLSVQTELTDVIRWEQQHGGAPWIMFPMPLERQLWVAWCAARRLKLTDVKEPALWISTVREFDEGDDEEPEADDEGDDGSGADDRGPTSPAVSA